MKKIVLFLMAALLFTAINAQTVNDAERLVKHQRYNSAGEMLNKMLATDPANGAAWYLLSQVYIAQNNPGQGKAAMVKATAAVHDPMYKAGYGHLLLQEGNPAEAQQYFESALNDTRRKNPGVLAAVAKAHIQEKQGNPEHAIELLKMAIKRDKKNSSLQKLMGDAYYRLNKGSESYQAYQDAIKLDNNNAEAMYGIAKIFKTQNNDDLYLQYFQNAIAADPAFAPALYELYYYYYYKDVAKAQQYLEQYISHSDANSKHDYMMADMLFLGEQYDKSIQLGTAILGKEQSPNPRIYKVMGYNYQGLNQPGKALEYMNLYLANENDSNIVLKDYEMMATLYNNVDKQDSALHFYTKAVALETDSTKQFAWYKKIADLYKDIKDYDQQAVWMEKYYTGNPNATNVDLFTWGLAEYMAQEYTAADTVFGMYTEKYPEQGFGFYWKARSNAALDPEMKEGRAVPYYEKLVEIAEKDTADANNKKWLVEAYGYIAAYSANEKKDYTGAIDYFEKLLEVDPGNDEAKKYIAILEKSIEKSTQN